MIEDMKEYKRLYNINFQRWKNGCQKAFSFVESLNYYYKDTEPYKPATLLEESEEFINGCCKLVKFCKMFRLLKYDMENYHTDYYQKNKDKNKLMTKKFKNKNPTYQKEYYQLNKAKKQQYYLDNTEHIKQLSKNFLSKNENYYKIYYEKTKEKHMEYIKKYYENKKAKLQAYYKEFYHKNKEDKMKVNKLSLHQTNILLKEVKNETDKILLQKQKNQKKKQLINNYKVDKNGIKNYHKNYYQQNKEKMKKKQRDNYKILKEQQSLQLKEELKKKNINNIDRYFMNKHSKLMSEWVEWFDTY